MSQKKLGKRMKIISMEPFVFEDELENVKSKKTQEYLKEVISTYNNNEYRSCIVMLYAITFTDILEKIQLLSDMYQDDEAIKFLEDYKNKRSTKAKYSDLELLIKDFAVKKGMLIDVEIKQWEHLKDYRDYCAHPVVSLNLELISPKREAVRAHIRNMFEAFFLKDAILHGKLFKEFITTLEDYYNRNKLDRFNEYINARYIVRLDKITKEQFFKNLWKFVFYIQETESNTYRKVAFNALLLITKSDKINLINFFEKEKNFFTGHIYFSKIDILLDSKDFHMHDYSSTALLHFLFEMPEIVQYISKDNLEELKNTAFKNINYLLLAHYLFQNSEVHIKNLKLTIDGLNHCISPSVMIKIWQKKQHQFDTSYSDFIIYYFFNCQNSSIFSPDWDYINNTYENIIQEVMSKFNQEQIENFLSQLTPFYKQANCFKELIIQINETVISNSYQINFSDYNIDITQYLDEK